MKKNNNLFTIISYFIIVILMIVKALLIRNEINILNLIIKDIIVISLITILTIIIKSEKKDKYAYVSTTILLLILGCIFKNFDSIAFVLLYLFIILITNTFMIITNYKFEISIVGSIFFIISLFIILGLLNILFLSKLFLLIITITSLIYIYKNKNKFINNNTNVTALTIYSVLFVIAVAGGIGRYVHSWDEYSYWAYAAKVCINEKSIYSVIEKLGNTRNYPPVATIWHYIVSSFSEGFNEPNLYIGLTILSFSCFMPTIKNMINANKKTIALFTIGIISFPLIFSGAYSYSLIYVDMLLSAMCTATIIFEDLYRKKEIDSKLYILSLVLITLLKPNGFVFSFTMILLFYLKDISEKKINIKTIFTEIKKYLIPAIFVVLIFISWTVLTKSNIIESNSYDYSLMPSILKSNLGPKLEKTFILNFVSELVKAFDKSIIFSFIEVPLFVYLILMGIIVYKTEDNNKKGIVKCLYPYIISYIVFFLVTALSIFVMFSKYEAENLASFGRYLAPINISYFIFSLYRMNKLKGKSMVIVLVLIIGLAGFSNITYFLTDIRERRDTAHISEARTEKFKEIIEKTKEDSKIFVINQEDEESIMPLWYARYYCYPRLVNSSSTAITWKIKTKENSWDLKKWGLTDRKLEKHLIEYDFDYVFFYSQTDELEKELDEFVNDVGDYDKGTLFKIIKTEDNNIKLELVK